MRASIKKLCYVIFGAFWVLLAIAGAAYLWLVLQVAKEDFAFFLPAMFSVVLLSMISFVAPLFLGITMGLLVVRCLYGTDVVKQSIYYGTRAKGILFLGPTFFIFSFALGIPTEALMDILGVPGEIFISPLGGPVAGDYLTYTGDYLRFPLIISTFITAFAIVVVGGHVVRKRNQ